VKHIHALTLTWNGLGKLERLRPTLAGVMADCPWSWHVRDNGSTDGTVDALKDWPEVSTLLPHPHNRGTYAEGVNRLADAANPAPDDVFLLLNNDIRFLDQHSIRKMEALIKPGVGAVGARLMFPDSTLQHAGVIFGPRYNNLPFHFRPREKVDAQARQNREFQAVSAAVMMVPCLTFAGVGGLDEGFRWAFEDIDLCLRIGATGKKIVYCGETEIEHEESATLKKNPVNKLFVNQNVRLFREKWEGKYQQDHEAYLHNPKKGLLR